MGNLLPAPDGTQYSMHEECNDNGLRIVSFATEKNMVVGSTMFPRKEIYKHTWVLTDQETQNQIDHVLIDA